MSRYTVIITQNAQNDLTSISDYITDSLNSPVAAINLELKLIESVLSLEKNPYRTPLFSEEIELVSNKEIRKLIEDNYIILLEISEMEKKVTILTIYNRLKNSIEI